MIGPAGSGRAERLLASAHRAAGWVFFHHAGLGGEASDPTIFLWRLLAALKRRCGFRDPLPFEPEVMREALPNWLARAAAMGSISIVLADAENLSRNGLEPDLDWLPQHLPPGVSVALSTRPGPSAELVRERVTREQAHVPTQDLADLRRRLRALMDEAPTRQILEWLWAARDGLSLASLTELCGQDSTAALETLADFVRSDGQRWILASALVREVAASRGLADHGQRQRLHMDLALHQAARGAQHSALLALWHLAAAGQHEQVIDQLASSDWLAAMTGSAYRYDALRYWRRLGDRQQVLTRLGQVASGELPAEALLGLVRLAVSLNGESPPREWLSQGLTQAIVAGDEQLQASFLESLGAHADTPSGDRLKWLGEALQIRRRRPEPGDAALAAVLHLLAVHHEEAQDLESAFATYREGMDEIEQRAGAQSTELIPWLNNLAGVCKARGELKHYECRALTS